VSKDYDLVEEWDTMVGVYCTVVWQADWRPVWSTVAVIHWLQHHVELGWLVET